ncbi:TlpA disulfide reductase family protein [Chitinophaga sp.]|uniref:TlpA family protein disulfide reductase n=1 Tax=Chitinophaga sp. TaxID=1869181 RepID=UPI0031D719E2
MYVKSLWLLLPALLIAGASPAQQTPFTRYVETRCAKEHKGAYQSAYVSLCELQLLEKQADGTLRIRATLLNYKPGKGALPERMTDMAEFPMNTTEPLLFVLLLQVPVEILYHPGGPARPRPELEQLVEEKALQVGIDKNHIKPLVGNVHSFLDREIRSVFLPVPPGTAHWFNADSTLAFTAAPQAGGARTITAVQHKPENTPGLKNEYSQVYQWNDAAGGLTSARLTTSVNGVADVNGKKHPLHYYDTVLLRVIEKPDMARIPAVTPELREMLIQGSSWSAALKDSKGVEYDSARVMAFIHKMDPLFGTSKNYVNTKLGLIQRMNIESSYEIYRRELKTVPDYMLEGNSIHLHNKLQNVWAKDADSAIQLIHYLGAARRQSLEDWLQHSFAQSVFETFNPADMERAKSHWRKNGLSEERIAELEADYHNSRRNAAGLLQRLAQDKDTVIRQAAYPMLLGMQATRTTNRDSLRLLAKAFGKLRTGERKYGNGSRYQLMLYKQMQANGMQEEAAATLKAVTAILEKGTADSLSSTRYTDQNMLAYAYFLRYEALKDKDAAQALNYYARAAAVSPRSKAERAHSSFYDRVMLKSEETYRPGFANALFKQGDSREAMKVMAQQVNADPSILPDVQKAFAQHMPNRDFKDFVHNTLVRTWKTAPDFELTSPDGKKYKLSDYRGKWLLVDFWGTWCQPCRKELPEVEKVSQSLRNSTESAFLSIACHDTPEKVTQFMEGEKYTFPVAMSDGNVERSYKVSGYPCKIMISPDGRMLEVAFNLDWKGAFQAFSQLQPPKTDGKQQTVQLEKKGEIQ